MSSTVLQSEIDLQVILQKMSEQTQDLNLEDDVRSLLKKTMKMLEDEYGLCPYLFRLSGHSHNINWQADELCGDLVEQTDTKFISSITRALSLLDPQKELYHEGINHATVAGHAIEFISIKLSDLSTAVLFWVKTDLDKIKSTCLEYFVKQLVVCVNSLNRLVHAQKLIHIDDLTGLYNYRYLEISLENEISRFERFGESFCVLFIDLDNFKPINDIHGHLSGSSVIKQVGNLLTEDLRTVDSVYRYGGDEFVVLLLGVSLARGYLVAERIRKRIEKSYFSTVDGSKVQVTSSIGVACCPDHGTNSKEILEVADNCMYESKKLGKNRVTIISKSKISDTAINYVSMRRK